jgi:hypothetical protein
VITHGVYRGWDAEIRADESIVLTSPSKRAVHVYRRVDGAYTLALVEDMVTPSLDGIYQREVESWLKRVKDQL